METKKILYNQRITFAFALIFFLIAAAFGWEKLHYGFNFIDEGYHMTESWRLAAGDHFLRDKITGAHRLYTLFNSLIFRFCPDITLLGFRKLQYFLTIFSLLFFSIALFKVDKQYWYQPFIFSCFAFTGLDPIGMISNLNYHTYPHLFLILHLSFLILGLYQSNRLRKRLMYVASGLLLWAISLTLLHLSVVILSPILLYLVSNRLRLKTFSFSFVDLCYVLAPFVFCWIIFVGIYNRPYIMALFPSITLSLSTYGHTPEHLFHIDWEALKHIGISMLFLLICLFSLKKLRLSLFILCLIAISILMFFIIDTSLFSLIAPYWRGWLSRPMWFSSLLISFFIIFWFNIAKKRITHQQNTIGEELSIIILLACTIYFGGTSIFSALGALTVLYCSIPAVVAITAVILYHRNIHMKPYLIKLLILIMFFLPFYYTTVWADWKFTFFDVSPELANTEIEEGFAKGIKTNRVYYDLYKWIRMNTEKYTAKDDFMISYVVSPMVYMISKRRPALDDTFTCFSTKPIGYFEKSIETMKKAGRHPKIAFVFESMPALYPVSLEKTEYAWLRKQFTFPSNDPISRYILENMRLLDEFKLPRGTTVRCFLDSKMFNKMPLPGLGEMSETGQEFRKH